MMISEAKNLQGNCVAAHECGSNLLIEIDHEVTLNRYLLVSHLDPLVTPLLELVSDDSINQVAQVALWKFFDCLGLWEVGQHLLVVAYLVPDQPACEGVVLGNEYELDGVASQKLHWLE